MDLETIFKIQREKNRPIKKIKVSEKTYNMMVLLLGEINTSNKPLGEIVRLGTIPIEVDDSVKDNWEVIYEEEKEKW